MSEQDGAAAQDNTDAAAQANQDKPAVDSANAAAAAAAKTAGQKPDAAAGKTAADQNPPANKDGQASKSGVPDKYALKLPDGSPLDASYVDKIAAHAKAQGLSQDAAQALLSRDSEILAEHGKAQLAQLKTQSDAWKEEFLHDPETGGDKGVENAELAHRVLAEWGDEPFVQELERTGLGNHPGLMKTFLRIGKAMQDGKIVRSKAPGGGGQKKSAEEILYPNNV